MKGHKIDIMDFYFDKINMILWPWFTDVFDHYLRNVKDAQAATFVLPDLKIYFTTERYVSLMSMLYKIAYKTGHVMLLSRLTQFQTLYTDFLERLSEEGFQGRVAPVERKFFRLNNIHFIKKWISELHIEHSITDMETLGKTFEGMVDSLADEMSMNHFSSLINLVNKHMPQEDSKSDDSQEQEDEPKAPNLTGLDAKKLEQVYTEFKMVYNDRV